MKPQQFAVVAGTLLLAVFVLIFTGKADKPGTERLVVQPPTRSVTVVGEGEYRAKPDVISVSVSLSVRGASTKEVEALNAASAKRVGDAMVDAGVEARSVEVIQLSASVSPVQPGSATALTYEIRSSVRGLLRKTDKLQGVLSAALDAGASSIEGINYQDEKPEQAKQAATKAAVDNARERARALVALDGNTLGDLRAVEVVQVDAPGSGPGGASGLVYRVQVRTTFDY